MLNDAFGNSHVLNIVTLNGLYGLKPLNFPELKIYGKSETYIKYVRTFICVIA